MSRWWPRSPGFTRALDAMDRLLGGLVAVAQWLCLPLALLLFLQWPLRELVQQGSREANDAAQVLFAVFIAVATTAATRARAHLAADAVAAHFAPSLRRGLGNAIIVVGVLPWALFVLASGAPSIWQSLRQLEGFPETFNPGYFIIRIASGLLVMAAAMQALLDLARGSTAGGERDDVAATRGDARP